MYYRLLETYISKYDSLTFDELAKEYQRVIHTDDTQLIFVVTAFAIFNAPHMYTGAHACWLVDTIKNCAYKFDSEVLAYLLTRLINFAYVSRDEPVVLEWFNRGQL